MAKKGKINMGGYTPSIKEKNAYHWCINNGIYIAPKAITEAKWSIVITNNGISNEDPNSYSKVLIWQKIYEYYKYYYEKQISQRR